MLRHGIPRDVVTALRSVSRAFRAWGGARAGRRTPLADGGELDVRAAARSQVAAPPRPLARRTRVFRRPRARHR